jgi:hypothetical protein
MKYARDPTARLDKLLARKALKEIAQLRKKYRGVVAIPEVVTIQDIAEYPMDTVAGPKKFKTLYPREIACRVLEALDGKDFISSDELAFTVAIRVAEELKERTVS